MSSAPWSPTSAAAVERPWAALCQPAGIPFGTPSSNGSGARNRLTARKPPCGTPPEAGGGWGEVAAVIHRGDVALRRCKVEAAVPTQLPALPEQCEGPSQTTSFGTNSCPAESRGFSDPLDQLFTKQRSGFGMDPSRSPARCHPGAIPAGSPIPGGAPMGVPQRRPPNTSATPRAGGAAAAPPRAVLPALDDHSGVALTSGLLVQHERPPLSCLVGRLPFVVADDLCPGISTEVWVVLHHQ
eukprot:gene15210-biopygen1554